MTQEYFLAPYAAAAGAVTDALSRVQWAQVLPEPESDAANDWAVDPDTMDWSVHAIRDADQHGLLVLDAAASALGSVSRSSDGPNDFAAVMASLRVSLESSAVAGALLSPRLTSNQRLNLFANLSLESLAFERKYAKAIASTSGIRDPERLARLAADEDDIIKTVQRRLNLKPKRKDGALFFEKQGSASQRVSDLFREMAGSRTKADKHAEAMYGLLSAPAHAAVSSIRLVFEPRLDGERIVSQRGVIPTYVVGNALMITSVAVLRAVTMLYERFGLVPADNGLGSAVMRLAEHVVSEDVASNGDQ